MEDTSYFVILCCKDSAKPCTMETYVHVEGATIRLLQSSMEVKTAIKCPFLWGEVTNAYIQESWQ